MATALGHKLNTVFQPHLPTRARVLQQEQAAQSWYAPRSILKPIGRPNKAILLFPPRFFLSPQQILMQAYTAAASIMQNMLHYVPSRKLLRPVKSV